MARTTKAAAQEAADNQSQALTPASKENGAGVESGASVVDVVVRHKRTVKHAGKTHKGSAKISLPADDAHRLKALGFVDLFSDLRAAAVTSYGVNISVSDGVTISQGD